MCSSRCPPSSDGSCCWLQWDEAWSQQSNRPRSCMSSSNRKNTTRALAASVRPPYEPRGEGRGAEETRSRGDEETRSRGAEEPRRRGAEGPRRRGDEEPRSRGAEGPRRRGAEGRY
ncbi:hypothetical protein EYF80_053283 [Liparis tanakae]|uniref:Uncharacterized protein n=1 Tax=Liparis tanakae TaxID=230148 RepID=A0A4Z2F5P1_9TELE|nr:hypothetical protein EYF80_053283 [Liparis tanakae]